MAKKIQLENFEQTFDRKLTAAEAYAARPRKWVLYTLIVLIIAYAMFKPSRKGAKGGKNGSVSWSAAANRKLKPLSEYRQLDEAFDETELTSKL